MGKTKRQHRKWRKIDTQEVEDFLEKSTREAQQGLQVDSVPDNDLFFVDTDPGDGAPTIQGPKLSKKLRARQRLTRAQAILQAVGNGKPVTVPPPPKRKEAIKKKERDKLMKARHASKGEDAGPQNVQSKSIEEKANSLLEDDLWTEVDEEGDEHVGRPKRRRQNPNSSGGTRIPAVEVDAPGCSFNPDRELHQDAVADAVAKEMKKEYDRALRPSAPLKAVDYVPETDELELLLVDADNDEQDDAHEDEDVGEDEEEKMFGTAKRRANEPKTQKTRNREARQKEEERLLEEKRRAKRLRAELSNLKRLQKDIDEELAERESRAMRRKADRAELAAIEPPRLGKLRYEPMSTQVLTTEELLEASGSLRRIRPTAMLAKERFKSLQRRGVIEVRRKAIGKIGKKVTYIHGKRSEKAAERQAEVDALRAARSKQEKGRKSKIANKVTIAGTVKALSWK